MKTITVTKLYDLLGKAIASGNGRNPVCIDKTTFQDNREGGDVTILDVCAAANIQAGVFEQSVAENQELRQQIDDLTQELEMERSKNSKRPHRKNVTLEIRKCAERIAKIGDTCVCGRPYTAKHHGCSDRLYFVCELCGTELLIG